ncbi:2Fe-2S iron-sulfur cluster-binding protein [Streptomyces tailanensis]|uniref:2Fe-2S iron-sulfur cluster-binding protein n=1 Tax=Streptomyces tailanensis TaxID=2569858 RepID=UPI00122DDF1B|nr:2Fe-2S iron-sulfur cluster-binding protein [Streptomyces tailanensis]
MTDDQHGEGTPQQQGGQSGWERLPQGDYDDGATTFVQLPEGGIDALLAANSPLAAPGHGYVPPPITANPAAGTDQSGTGHWAMPAEGTQWHDPNAGQPQPATQDGFTYDPGATGQWTFEEPAQQENGAPGHDVTGEWSIPVAGGDLPDESGEFSASALVEQWGGTPPATLPGGAPAPWATSTPAPTTPPTPVPTEAIGTAWTAPPPAEHSTEATEEPAEAPEDPSGESYAEPAPVTAQDAPEAAQEPSEPVREADPETPEPEETGEPGEDPADDAAEGPETAAEAPEPEPEPGTATGVEADTATADEPGPPSPDDHPLASYVLRVNGTDRPVTDAWIGESLLYVLRERLGLAGAKDGCSQGECGACNVQVDGRLVASCLVPAVTAASSEVRTVEGLAADGQPSDVQRALAKCGAVQCGFCVPGMAMTVHDLLEGNPAPTDLETRQALCGNLCRCSGYRGVLAAVREVVAEREAHAAAGNEADAEADEARIPHQAGPGAGGVNPAAYDAQAAPPSGAQDPSTPGPDQSYGGQGQPFAGGPDDTYGGQGQSFAGHDNSYGGQDDSYGGQGDSYGGQDRSFGQDGGQA